MDFEFSDTQRQLQGEVRKFLAVHSAPSVVRRGLDGTAPFDRALWQGAAALGLMAVAIPELYGGAGGGVLELCAVAEEIGRALAPIPFSSTVYLGAELLLAVGSEAQKHAFLPRIAAGDTIACLGLTEGLGNPSAGSIAMTATPDGASGSLLHGEKWPVLDGEAAGLAIVVARDGASAGQLSLFLVDLEQNGVARTRLQSIDPTRGQARLRLASVRGERLGPAGAGWAMLEGALQRAAVLTAFEQVGGAEQALQAARDYALQRIAFGRPIGAFQAIKHKLVDMYVAVVLARSNAYFGAWAASADPASLARAAASARVSATEAFQLCARENIQIHGGMGFTWESDCHLYYRRSQLLALTLGGLSAWQDRLVASLRPAPARAGVAAMVPA